MTRVRYQGISVSLAGWVGVGVGEGDGVTSAEEEGEGEGETSAGPVLVTADQGADQQNNHQQKKDGH